MKKVVYSISKLNKFGSTKMTGVGFITDSDLIIACVSQKGNPYIRVFEDCVKNCHRRLQGREMSRPFQLVQLHLLRRRHLQED